jgi:uncharacterized protein YdaU (DUF1376 family)
VHKYMFHIGDYHSHTSHLEPLEDLAYRRILDRYYLQEAPLKGTSTTVARALGLASSTVEVDYVLSEFFTQDDDGYWRQERAEEEIVAYQSHKAASKRGGKASGKARKQAASEPPLKAPSTTLEPTVNRKPLTVNQQPKDNSGRFTPPSIDEVRDYCVDKGYTLDPERFINFYESKNWMVGKNKMQKWKAAAANWEKRNTETPVRNQGTTRGRTLEHDLTDTSWAK